MRTTSFRRHVRIILAVGAALITAIPVTWGAESREYHVAVSGDDAADGSQQHPLRTISAAAMQAQPGDVITVHEGVYRERIDPPRGGTSDQKRITYRAAEGEQVVIKGSEVVTGWEKVGNDTWKLTLPDAFFGEFNPFKELIRGDWFNPKGRAHHVGAVYLDGHWLTEAATLDEVLKPADANPLWYTPAPALAAGGNYLVNIAWLQPLDESGRVSADRFTKQNGIQTAACREGGQCIGWIDDGDWVSYENVDFGSGSERVEIRAASPTGGATIEIRQDQPNGRLLGTCTVADTGDWQRWQSFVASIQPTKGKQTICLVFRAQPMKATPVEMEDDTTTIWGQFKDVDPNQGNVEINVREAVFYPEKTGVNYITVRGFTLEHAAPNWAPPTAEQVGLIGTHWSKGWIIEDNTIRYSACTGVTLGKYGDEWDNRAQSAEGYVGTINRALANGWSKERIGHHVVRNNRISHCEQAGIVGSLGAAFSTVTGNTIHDIHVRQLFGGAEMAAIKFHAPIDSLIADNHIYRTGRGIWLDWMTQGTRVTRNLVHDTSPREDLFVEVNHGPFLVDNNILLSPLAIAVNSCGGAYAHNLIAGRVSVAHREQRETPYHKPHSTEVAGLHGNPSGDDRYYNNIFVNQDGLIAYDQATLPVFMAGNVFYHGAKPSIHEKNPTVLTDQDPGLELAETPEGLLLKMTLEGDWRIKQRPLVTTELLGKALVPNLPYVQPDDSAWIIDTDYLGKQRNTDNPSPGPIEFSSNGKLSVKVESTGR